MMNLIRRHNLTRKEKQMLEDMSKSKRALMDNPGSSNFVLTHRRKSPGNMLNMEDRRKVFKKWLMTKSEQMTQLCNKQDQVFAREHMTNKKIKGADGKPVTDGEQLPLPVGS